mmetsp:Transcript_27579/g.34123  ORF Transcript_27579/g.34123 Transcript_27579/m.34123 type:complete len:163 (-) Transcript_27579:1095-1583(-)
MNQCNESVTQFENEKGANGNGSASNEGISHSDKIAIARQHFERKGYRVHSGLQFGCELVLYADDPSRVHSDFCVHVPASINDCMNWMTIQTLVRSMPDLHKTLIIVSVKQMSTQKCFSSTNNEDVKNYAVEEIAVVSEHAPFRHKNTIKEVGAQVKKQKRSN